MADFRDGSCGGALLCTHCGEQYEPRYPIPLRLMSALAEAFMREHRRHTKMRSPELADRELGRRLKWIADYYVRETLGRDPDRRMARL